MGVIKVSFTACEKTALQVKTWLMNRQACFSPASDGLRYTPNGLRCTPEHFPRYLPEYFLDIWMYSQCPWKFIDNIPVIYPNPLPLVIIYYYISHCSTRPS